MLFILFFFVEWVPSHTSLSVLFLFLKMKPLGFFETSGRAYKNSQHKIPYDLNRQKHCCEEVTSWKTRSSLSAIIMNCHKEHIT